MMLQRKIFALLNSIIKRFKTCKKTKIFSKFEQKYLNIDRNRKTTTCTKKLIITNLQNAIGDQICCLDIMGRISKYDWKKNYDFLIINKFQRVIFWNNKNWNLNYVFCKYSLGSQADGKKGKHKYKNILKIAKAVKKWEYDEVLIFGRALPPDIAIILASIKTNSIYKFFDSDASKNANGVFWEWPNIKDLILKIFEKLKNKINIVDIDNTKHFIINCINFFNTVSKTKKIEFTNNYEHFIVNKKSCKSQIKKVFFLINRVDEKIVNLETIIESFKNFNNSNVLFIFVIKSKYKEIRKCKKIISSKLYNYKFYSNIRLKKMVELMNCSDLVVCHDSMDYHFANLYKLNFILILNREYWVTKYSFNYWIKYENSSPTIVFANKSSFGVSKKIEEDKTITKSLIDWINKASLNDFGNG